MPQVDTRMPRRQELWLSRPPFLLIARITDVGRSQGRPVVSYDLHDDDGSVLEHVHTTLDSGWWQTFQPLVRRCG